MNTEQLSIFWFRRDLRLEDNAGLFHALRSGHPVLPLFIFDTEILDKLPDKSDKRVEFIYVGLREIQAHLKEIGSGLLVHHGNPVEIWKQLIGEYDVAAVFANGDYEPEAIRRDQQISDFLEDHGIPFHLFKDQVIFEKKEIMKSDGNPYVVYTPYKNRWLDSLNDGHLNSFPSEHYFQNYYPRSPLPFPQLEEIGFSKTGFHFPPKQINKDLIKNYDQTRDFPALEGTTRLGIHLRFGTISIRRLIRIALELNPTFLSELIWREFFMMILHNFQYVVDRPFREAYRNIQWINDEQQFQRWRQGATGYPMVDAGMRQLNATGFMHNRVRMLTASFLTKNLLIDWRWGEQYFAEKLLDFDLSSNNGNWQWAAGCGCDAAPYFRVFNPETQMKRFDPDLKYVKEWVPEYASPVYPKPIVDYKYSRERALAVYKVALS